MSLTSEVVDVEHQERTDTRMRFLPSGQLGAHVLVALAVVVADCQ